MKDSDKTWQYFGRTDPYFGVLSHPSFKTEQLDESARHQFFDSGRRYVDYVLELVSNHLDASFRPTRALDFGCGVGRLTIPLARVCQSVVGVDVSDGMLAEARKNAEGQGATNITFVKADDSLSAVTGDFDLLNSLIVFQHIPPRRGEAILKMMLQRLREGGVGILQFTYGFASSTPWTRKALVRAYHAVPLLWSVRNLLKGRPLLERMMQMNEYDPAHLLRILQEGGCHLVHARFTETNSFGYPFYGVILFFQKRRLEVTAHA
ncbi:MAG TPA: methyltransferase domain-containing protein [Myxococcaceae bacterium]|nr:methyltransferase domain-containing protein [Myxococcaceae bacterium]